MRKLALGASVLMTTTAILSFQPAHAAVRWVSASYGRTVPQSVSVGAYYVCRVSTNAGYMLGLMSVGHRSCLYSYAGKERSSTQYELLTASRHQWIARNTPYPPNGAMGGGSDSGKQNHVCAVWYGNEWRLGRYHIDHDKCFFGYAGKEVASPHLSWLFAQ